MGIPFFQQLMMRFRKVPVGKIKRCMARLEEAGIEVSPSQLETQSLAGGDPELVVEAMLLLSERGIHAPWNTISVLQLTGRDLVECVDLCTNPRDATYDSSVDGENPPNHAVCQDGTCVAIHINYRFIMRPDHIIGFEVDNANEGLANQIRDAAHFCSSASELLERKDRLHREFEARLSGCFGKVEGFSLEMKSM